MNPGLFSISLARVVPPFRPQLEGHTRRAGQQAGAIVIDRPPGSIIVAMLIGAPKTPPGLSKVRLSVVHRGRTFDRDDVYSQIAEHHPDAAVIVPPHSNATPSETAETTPTQRDGHLQIIADRARMPWQKLSGYNWRALIEADISRYKRVIGDTLRSRTESQCPGPSGSTATTASAAASLYRSPYWRRLFNR